MMRSALLVCLAQLLLVQKGWEVCSFESPNVFPAKKRQELVEKSQTINPPTRYTAEGSWSNRAGTVLTPVHLNPGVYGADRSFIWNSIDVGGRMTVIELPSSTPGSKEPDLWIHSPVALDDAMKETISKLGKVKYVVSPNYEHLKYAAAWQQGFPEADMWGCPGLMERMENIQWKGEIPFACRPKGWKSGKGTVISPESGMWDTELLQPLHLNMEKNPFTGKPFFSEVLFYHAPSKTLLFTDFFWNYPADGVPNSEHGQDDSWELAPAVEQVPFTSRLWKFGMDKVYTPFFNNLMVIDPVLYRDICHHIVHEWDVETIVPCHGDILRGKDFIRKVLTKFLRLN